MKHRARWVVLGMICVGEEHLVYRITSYNTKLTKDEAIEKFKVALKTDFGDVEVADVVANFYEESVEDG